MVALFLQQQTLGRQATVETASRFLQNPSRCCQRETVHTCVQAQPCISNATTNALYIKRNDKHPVYQTQRQTPCISNATTNIKRNDKRPAYQTQRKTSCISNDKSIHTALLHIICVGAVVLAEGAQLLRRHSATPVGSSCSPKGMQVRSVLRLDIRDLRHSNASIVPQADPGSNSRSP
jgi:hypothetical protein